MSTIPCKDCGQQISRKAEKCPNCGRPQAKPGGCLLQMLGLIVVGVILVWWFSTGWMEQTNATIGQIRNQVAEDAVAQYRIAAEQGDRMQRCVQAGFVSAAFLQAQDSAHYEEWKAQEKKDCRAAGVVR